MKARSGALTIAMILLASAMASAESYSIDEAHSKVLFKVRHLGISTVTGQFRDFSGSFTLDKNDLSTLKARVAIVSSSVDTEEKDRDDHLRSGDFLGVEEHPEIRFESSGAERAGAEKVVLRGNLTIRGVTKPVTLEAAYGGAASFQGKERVAFTATGRINRKDFGVSWNRTLDSGGLVVADHVDIVLEVEGVAGAASE